MRPITRGLMGLDLDDKILWLRRGDPTDPEVKAFLVLGPRRSQAIERGDEAKAIAHFREAIAIYDAMPENAATLNNSALDPVPPRQADRRSAAFDRGIARIEKAHKLEPGDSVTMMNDGLASCARRPAETSSARRSTSGS